MRWFAVIGLCATFSLGLVLTITGILGLTGSILPLEPDSVLPTIPFNQTCGALALSGLALMAMAVVRLVHKPQSML